MISPVATSLLEAIDNYLEASCKKEYRLTFEEQIKIQNAILVLDKQLDVLIDYETKREKNA